MIKQYDKMNELPLNIKNHSGRFHSKLWKKIKDKVIKSKKITVIIDEKYIDPYNNNFFHERYLQSKRINKN